VRSSFARGWESIEDFEQAGNFALAAAGGGPVDEIKIGVVVVKLLARADGLAE
jgi:hypothetical protein